MKKYFFLLLVVLATDLFAKSCWNVHEDDRIASAEMDGVMIFSFKDAVSCKPIKHAKIHFLGVDKTTDSFGEVRFPVPPDNVDRDVILEAQKAGYISLTQRVKAAVGSYWQTKFLMTKDLPINSARFVLSWGATPKDLDLHLISNSFHISYRNKQHTNQAVLDRDAREGFGPETITLKNIKRHKEYRLYVNRYSNDGKMDGHVSVAIYKNNKLDRVIRLPKTSHKCMQIAIIKNKNIKYSVKAVADRICK